VKVSIIVDIGLKTTLTQVNTTKIYFNSFGYPYMWFTYNTCKGKGKTIPLQASIGPEGFRRLRLPDLKT
jgi:hypothetical protein